MIQAKFGLPGIALRTLEVYTSATLDATLAAPPPVDPRLARRRWTRVAAAAQTQLPAASSTTTRGSCGTSAPRRRRRSSTACTSAAVRRGASRRAGLAAPARDSVAVRVDADAAAAGVVARRRGTARRRRCAAAIAPTLPRDVPRVAVLPIARSTCCRWRWPRPIPRSRRTTTASWRRPTCSRLPRRCGPASRRPRARVLAITGQRRAAGRQPALRRSIDVRNPYVDPINLVQVELLRRLAALRDERGRAIRRRTKRESAHAGALRRALRDHDQRHRGRLAQHRVNPMTTCNEHADRHAAHFDRAAGAAERRDPQADVAAGGEPGAGERDELQGVAAPGARDSRAVA